MIFRTLYRSAVIVLAGATLFKAGRSIGRSLVPKQAAPRKPHWQPPQPNRARPTGSIFDIFGQASSPKETVFCENQEINVIAESAVTRINPSAVYAGCPVPYSTSGDTY